MTRVQHIALRVAALSLATLIILEWIAGCGTPDGQCLAIPITYTTIMGGQ